MSTFAVSVDRQATQAKATALPSPVWQLAIVIFLALLSVFPALYSAWTTWISDPLRSVGVLFPFVCLLFLIQGWRRFQQPLRGTLWGLIPAMAAIALLWLREHSSVHLLLSHTLEIDPLPAGLALSLMFAGVLLLVGGWRLLRTLLFPVILFGLTNPVPHLFGHLDLPLQEVSAQAARRFATFIGEHPTGSQLQLMFAPDFGMFIAPGCNGIRGAVTLGYLALFASAWRGFTVRVRIAFLVAGVAVGYLFNLVRLFALVLYYKTGQWLPLIKPYGTQVDYAIGGTLFLLASYALGRVVFSSDKAAAELNQRTHRNPTLPHSQSFSQRMAAMMCLCLAPAFLSVHAFVHDALQPRIDERTSEHLPQVLGPYHLSKQWNEFSEEHIMVYRWARYSDGNANDDVSLGLWLPRTEHDIRYSHASRGERLYPQQSFVHQTPGLGQVAYAAYLYDDGLNDVLLASLLCKACDSAIPGTEHRLGPLKIVSSEPTVYFRRPHPHTAVLTHTAPHLTTTPTGIRKPIDLFLSHLDETKLLLPETATPHP